MPDFSLAPACNPEQRGQRAITQVHTKEKQLEREITHLVESGLRGVEVLAVELAGPDRFTVYVDHPQGVDHALCERVTNQLREYLRTYSVEVSSPGFERPLRKPAHFERAVGRRISVRTGTEIGGRKRFRGEVVAADAKSISLEAGGPEAVRIPYEAIVRGNLIHEG